MINETERAVANGLPIAPQVGARSVGALTTLDGNHIFMLRPSYVAVAHLPLAERVIALRDPARRAAILSEKSDPAAVAANPQLGSFIEMLTGRISGIFPMSLPLDYEPGPDDPPVPPEEPPPGGESPEPPFERHPRVGSVA